MRDYEELVRALRTMSDWAGLEFFEESENVKFNLSEAADAIEELTQCLDGVSVDNDSICEKNAVLSAELTTLRGQLAKWISVKDRLPEKQGFYLCAVGASCMPVRIMEYRPYGIYENERLWVTVGAAENHYVFDWFVHAWMPLPEPPKEDANDQPLC